MRQILVSIVPRRAGSPLLSSFPLSAMCAVFALFAPLTLGASSASAEPMSRVFINASATPVFFNDGDSFRIQAGPFKGSQARLSGYNTLESFGPHHSWGSWTAKELYVIAKKATLEARRGVWHCEGDGKKDGYGRLLLFCKDLATHLIKNGLAHTYSVDQNPGDPDLLAVQREAMRERRGMWAHGVPRFVMTSLHSKDEGGDKNGNTSNRLISTLDAHSDKWQHEDTYAECQKVCHKVPAPSSADMDQNLALLREAADAGKPLQAQTDDDARATTAALVEGVLRGAKTADELAGLGVRAPGTLSAEQVSALLDAAHKLHAEKRLQINGEQNDSCLVYVDFRRRFGGDRAVCLR